MIQFWARLDGQKVELLTHNNWAGRSNLTAKATSLHVGPTTAPAGPGKVSLFTSSSVSVVNATMTQSTKELEGLRRSVLVTVWDSVSFCRSAVWKVKHTSMYIEMLFSVIHLLSVSQGQGQFKSVYATSQLRCLTHAGCVYE